MEGKSTTERYKLIAAIVLGVVAVASIGFLFFGDSFSSPKVASNNKNNNSTKTSSTSKPITTVPQQNDDPTIGATIAEVVYSQTAPPSVGGGRNIFDIYIPPTPTPTPIPVIVQTPTPKPPLDLYSVSPANVFAKTSDFTIQANGDKFTPDSRISFDNNELPTKYISPQQLSATVPAAFIFTDGARLIMVRTPGGLYSNTGTLNVMAPPMPNYLYVGLIGDKRYKDDVALMRNKNDTKDLFSIRLNETINEKTENRFKVISISEREIVLIDKILKIKHPLPYTTGGNTSTSTSNNPGSFPQNNQRGFPQGAIPGIPNDIQRYQPPQQVSSDDDEDDEKPNPTVKTVPVPSATKRP